MPFHLARIEDCPPDQPWLLSSRAELERDACIWKTAWTEAFPGAASSYDAKQAWASRILGDRLGPISTRDKLAEILYEACPETVTLQIVVARKMLDALLKHLKSAECAFFACAERRQGGAETPEGYVSWLRDAAAGTSVGGDLLLLASCEAKKAERVNHVALALLRRLGMENAEPTGDIDVRNRLGEMWHFPEGAGQAVALELLDFGKVRGKNAFLEGLESREKASEGRLTYSHFSGGRRGGALCGELLRALAAAGVQRGAAAHAEALRRLRRDGKREAEAPQAQPRQRPNLCGNLMISLFDAELNAIKAMKGKQLPSKLCAMLALTQTMADDTYWLYDNKFSVSETAASLLKDVSGYWRNTLLCHKNSNEALGLGLPEERGSSREALEFFLRFLGQELESVSHGLLKFNCVPGPPRKRQRPSEDSEVVGRARLR